MLNGTGIVREQRSPPDKVLIPVHVRRFPLPLLMLAGASLVLAGCGSAAVDLEVGECLDSDDLDSDEISTVTTLDCEEPHDVEIFGEHLLPDGDFPGMSKIQQVGEEECGDQFFDFVGTEGTDSGLQYSYLSPSEETWDDGDRTVLCMAVSDEPVTGTMAG